MQHWPTCLRSSRFTAPWPRKADGSVISLGMSIETAYRGQGIGTALLSAAVDWARSRETVHKLELEVWPHNTAALALYSRRTCELWDSIVMAWSSTTPAPVRPTATTSDLGPIVLIGHATYQHFWRSAGATTLENHLMKAFWFFPQPSRTLHR